MVAPDTATVSELNARARADRVAAGQVAEAGVAVADGQVAGDGGRGSHPGEQPAPGHWQALGEKRRPMGRPSDQRGRDHGRAPGGRRGRGRSTGQLCASARGAVLCHHRLQGTGPYGQYGPRHGLADHYPRSALRLGHEGTRGEQAVRGHLFRPGPADISLRGDGSPKRQGGAGRRPGQRRSGRLCPRGYTPGSGPVRGLRRAGQRVPDHRPGSPATALRLPARPLRAFLGALASVQASDAYGPLLAALRDAEARGLDVDAVLPRLAAARHFAGADDPAAVLHARVERWAVAASSRRQARPNLVAGLIPRAMGVSDPDLARALQERDQAMERRARELGEQAVGEGRAWARRLGPPPADSARREAWLQAVSTVAAFRERWDTRRRPAPPRA